MNKKNRPVIPETVKNKNNKINKECAGMKKLIKVKDVNGKLVVSSREVAENFGKTHSHVLRDLDKIVSEEPSLVSQIVLSSYKAKGNNKTYKEYLLTKDGFTLYIFNIQGHNDFKKAYIERFNEMENKLKGIENNPPQKVSEVSREEFNNLKNTVDTLTSIVNTLTQVTNTLTNVIANNQDIPKPQEEEKEEVKSNPVIIRRDKNDNPNKKEVVAIVFENNKPVVICKYDSQTIASKEIGLGRHTISKCCNGNHGTSLKDNYNRAVYLYNLEDFEIEYPSVKVKKKI